MIKIKDTKNMIGITIHGDYEDLQALHGALSDYLRFYFDHQEGREADSCYETILGLCYDIRHAYQGDRNIESVENNYENIAQLACCIYQVDESAIKKERRKYKNGNLYFNVEVLYPWAIYYLFALQAIAEDYYQHAWFQDDELGYTEYQAECDLALIQYFVHLLWTKLREHLPEEVTAILWDHTRICNHIEYYYGISDLYMEWLCTYWINAFRGKSDRKAALPLICFELSSILDEYEEELVDIISEAEEQNKSASDIAESTDAANNTAVNTPADEQAEFERKILNIQSSIALTALQGLTLYDKYLLTYCEDLYKESPRYLSQDDFETILYHYVQGNGPLTEESYEKWLDQEAGEVNWERVEW